MEEARGELLHLPHHRDRPQLRSAERLTTPEEASQQTLKKLFDEMVDVAAMPTQHADRLLVDTDFLGDNLEREVIMFQLSQRQNDGFAFLECVDNVVLVRENDVVVVVDYIRTYYQGHWRPARKPDELQYNWVQDYQDGSLGVVDSVLTDGVAQLHTREAKEEINRRAQEQRLRYMVGVVAMTRPVS